MGLSSTCVIHKGFVFPMKPWRVAVLIAVLLGASVINHKNCLCSPGPRVLMVAKAKSKAKAKSSPNDEGNKTAWRERQT